MVAGGVWAEEAEVGGDARSWDSLLESPDAAAAVAADPEGGEVGFVGWYCSPVTLFTDTHKSHRECRPPHIVVEDGAASGAEVGGGPSEGGEE